MEDGDVYTVHPFDDYILARSTLDSHPAEDRHSPPTHESPAGIREDDLFAGLR